MSFFGHGVLLRKQEPKASSDVRAALGSCFRRSTVALSLVLVAPVLAASDMPSAPLANTQLSDPAQEAKAKALMETLRCLVCQGQSIADSNADLAADMRSLVRQRIQAGESPEAVRAWLIQRYGNWVSYKPELGVDTAILWLAPLILLAIGGVIALGSLKRRRR